MSSRPLAGSRNQSYFIRPATRGDPAEIARLASQLGYPASVEVMSTRLERLLQSSKDAVFVAEIEGSDRLAGWIHAVLSQHLESDYRIEIAGLVVDEAVHGKGTGRLLVSKVEEWGIERGAAQSVVRCRTTRPGAHLFYERLGYSRTKEQIVFRKALRSPPSEVT
jgi:GNAT superfamily N-acetyltransferase